MTRWKLEVAIGSSKNRTRDVVPHNIARAGLCRPEERFTKLLFGLAAAILVQLPRSTRAFVIGIWHRTPPSLGLLHSTLHIPGFCAQKISWLSQKKGLTLGPARADALVCMRIKPVLKSETSPAWCMHSETSCPSRSVAVRTADHPRISESSRLRPESAMDVSADVASKRSEESSKILI